MKLDTKFVVTGLLALAFLLPGATKASYGIYPTKSALWPKPGHRPSRAGKYQVLYYGGPVISNVRVYAVFWGSSVDADVQHKIGGFYAATVNSTHMDWLSEYNTDIKAVDGRPGTNQSFGRGSFGREITIIPTHTSKNLDDKDIQAEIDLQVANNVLPTPDGNTLFMIHFPPSVNITIEGMTSCQNFCAYHYGFKSQTLGNVFYGVIPDFKTGACSFNCGFSQEAFDSTTIISSHELLEAMTDPFPTPGSNPAYPQAWNTTSGDEIGDLCAVSSTPLKVQNMTYLLQKEYSNAAGSCASGPYQSP